MLKQKAYRSKKYLDWVKSQDCVLTGMPADDAHHIIGVGEGGMGMKAPDYYTIPVTRGAHQRIHAEPELWEQQWEWVAKTLGKAISEGVI